MLRTLASVRLPFSLCLALGLGEPALLVGLAAPARAEAPAPLPPEDLETQLRAVREDNRQLRERLDMLEDEVRSARDDAAAARSASQPLAAPAPVPAPVSAGPLAETTAGSARLQ